MRRQQELHGVINCCVARFERGDPATWKHSDFNELSAAIYRETRTVISSNTLKRIFGKISVDEDYVPQQATLAALKTYGNYTPGDTPAQNNLSAVPIAPKRRTLLWILPAGLAIICVVLYFVVKPGQAASGSIGLNKIEGHLPATAILNVKFEGTTDSVFADMGDKSALVNVLPSQKVLLHNYLMPGVFSVKLLTRHQTLARTSVVIRSDKWIGLGFRRQRDLPAHYYEFPAYRSGADSAFHISHQQLVREGLDTNDHFFTRLCNFTPTRVSGDDLVFETTLKNPSSGRDFHCRGAQFHIQGAAGAIRFKLTNPGCSYWVLNIISERSVSGQKADLSKFVLDLNQWNTIRLVNQNKHLVLTANGKQIYSGQYKRSLGLLQGLFIEFEGNGFVKAADLSSGGKSIYHF